MITDSYKWKSEAGESDQGTWRFYVSSFEIKGATSQII